MKIFTEGIFTAIMKMLSFPKIVDAVQKYKDVTNSSEFKSDWDDYQAAKKDYEESLRSLCRDYPESQSCKDYNKDHS